MEKLKALRLTYEAQVASAIINLDNYKQNSVGVAEHPDIISSMDSLIGEIAEAREKLEVVEELMEQGI
tara:strand:- start:2678 stop:2881 length:204 start_codon:yes stop_codon:yes gene_type:complete